MNILLKHSNGNVVEFVDKLLVTFKTKCQPWFNENPKNAKPLYRGITVEDSEDLVLLAPEMKNRLPRDMSSNDTELLNFLIKLNGRIANRYNSFFTTGDLEFASSFGTAFIFIPIGDFKYTWNTAFEDLVHQDYSDIINSLFFSKKYNKEYDSFGHYLETIKNNKNLKEMAKDFIGDDKTLLKAIDSGHELMIHAQSALLIDARYYEQYIIPELG